MLLAKAGSGYDYVRDFPALHRPERRRVVRKARRVSPMTRIVAVWIVVASLALAYVGERAIIITLTYGLGDLRQKLSAAQVDGERLQLSISELSSLQRVEQEARADLGMVAPRETAYLDTGDMPVVADGGVEGELRAKGTVASRTSGFLGHIFTSVAKAAGR